MHFNSAVDGVTQKPLETTITPRKVSIKPTGNSSATLTMTATPPPNEHANLLWTWTVDGKELSIAEDNAAGYYVHDIDWRVVRNNNHSDIKYQTTIVNHFQINVRDYSEHNLVGFGHYLPQVDSTYNTTCFTAHGITPNEEKVSSNEVCSTHNVSGTPIIIDQ